MMPVARKEEETEAEAIGKQCVSVSAPTMAIAQAEAAERGEGRFTAMLEQRREHETKKACNLNFTP
jgi:hypothetical protein